MGKIYKLLGKNGEVTIPFELRKAIGFKHNDIVSFSLKDENTIIVRRENNTAISDDGLTLDKEASLFDVINSLGEAEQKAVFKYLARKLTDLEDL